MAGLRKVLTFLLLAGARGAVDVPARNLQDSGSPNGLIDANCIIKCPGAMTMLLDLQSFFPKDVSWQDLLGGAVMDLVGVLFQAMCKHTSVMTCMATQCVPENATTTVNDMNISFDSLAQFMPCICDACPGIQTLLASMASVAPTLQNLTSVTTDALNAACPMVGATECLVSNAQCVAFVTSYGELGTAGQAISQAKSTCETAGIPTSPTTTTTTTTTTTMTEASQVNGAAICGAGAATLFACLMWN